MLNKKNLLTLAALFTGGFVPIHFVVLSFGYAQYMQGETLGPKVIRVAHEFGLPYTLYLYIPALIALTWIILYSRKHYPDLFKRIVIGIAAGAIATIALDWIRQMGVINGWLPGDNPPMFGQAMTGSNNFVIYHTVGQLIHFMNGANIGITFTLLLGNFNTYGKTILAGIGWLMFFELGMMIGPPMAPMTGMFGINYVWPQMFFLTLTAHVASGITLGYFVHHWLGKDHQEWILPNLMSSKS